MRCKICRVSFKPVYFLQKTCSKDCEKQYKVETKKQPKVKEVSDKEKLQILINKLVRLIDRDAPCISSRKFTYLQAGHFYSISSHPELRFNLCNIYGQSKEDNCYKHSNRKEYEQGLINEFGQEWANYVFGLPLTVKSGNIYTKTTILCRDRSLSEQGGIYRDGIISTNSKHLQLYSTYANTVHNIIQQYDTTRTNSPTERIRQRLEFNHRIFGYSIPEGFSI